MIRDLDATLRALLKGGATPDSELAQADLSFDLPDSKWRGTLGRLTVNLYLYDVCENVELRSAEPIVVRDDQRRAVRRPAPVRIDCSYCITAWSIAASEAVLEEHRLLSQALVVLLRNPTIPTNVLAGSLASQIPPYPTVIASRDGVKNQPDFWHALDQKLKPSLNYVITLAAMLDEVPAGGTRLVDEVDVRADQPPFG
jgi:hypothetical protein